jgi:hypothetical protein
MEASTQILKESLGSLAMMNRFFFFYRGQKDFICREEKRKTS